MPQNPIENIEMVADVAQTVDFSIIGLFMGADIVVKLVVLILIVASLWSWTVVFSKFVKFRQTNHLSNKFEDAFWACESFDELHRRIGNRPSDPLASVFCAGMQEWQRSSAKKTSTGTSGGSSSVQQRIERAMQITSNRQVEELENNMGFLASIGSTAPFIGLFGTVWGIVHSFQSIAVHKNTSLAVVAPGIAEALFATALGLIVAIPAVIFYNKLSSMLNAYVNRLDSFSGEFISAISRNFEQ